MGTGRTKLVASVALFVGLTVAGALWALSRAPISLSDLWVITRLPTGSLIALGVLCAGIYVTDVLRYRSVGRSVGTTIPWRAAFDASVANFFFSWITPGATFGVPATIYMLGRRGVPWDATVAVAFVKSFTGVGIVVLASLVFVITGLGPSYDAAVLGVVLFGGGVFATLLGLLVAAAFRPPAAKRVIARWFGWLGRRFGGGRRLASAEQVTGDAIDRLAQLRTAGPWVLLWMITTQVLYFAVFASVGVVLMQAFGGEVGVRPFAATVIYIAFTYLAPTPGGAGFAEAMALPFFGPLLPADQAVLFVLSFRGLTLYLQIGFAIPYMLVVGGVREIAARVDKRDG
ncbi:hypothetical protein BH11MYX3_BH11MYX3_37150 [soil metagenome]